MKDIKYVWVLARQSDMAAQMGGPTRLLNIVEKNTCEVHVVVDQTLEAEAFSITSSKIETGREVAPTLICFNDGPAISADARSHSYCRY